MVGVVLIVIALALAIPVGVMLGGAAWTALMGLLLADDADERAQGEPT